MSGSSSHPQLKLIYLLGLSVLLFAVASPPVIVGLLLLQAVLWVYSRLSPALLQRTLRRLAVFFTVITLSYAFLPLDSGAADRWQAIPLAGWTLEINTSGVLIALLMCLRVLTLVLASLWVQHSGPPEAFIQGMTRLQVPAFLAMAIESTLDLISGGSGGGGTGKGKGGGTGKGKRHSSFSLAFAQIRHGDLSFVQERIDHSLDRAIRRIQSRYPDLPLAQARDLATVVGIAAAIMGLKVIQILPGLPVAPGHKNILIVPLFLLASSLTRSRFGGFWTGMTVGILNFLLGYGKYGILELAQFALPGLMADLLLPMTAGRGRWLRLVQFGLIGAVLGLSRFTANILVIILAGAPLTAFVIYLPMLFSQVIFGMVSALVSVVLVRGKAADEQPGQATEHKTSPP